MNENVTMPSQKASPVLTVHTAFASDEHLLPPMQHYTWLVIQRPDTALMKDPITQWSWLKTQEIDPGLLHISTLLSPVSLENTNSKELNQQLQRSCEEAERTTRISNIRGHVPVPRKEGTRGTKRENQVRAETWTNVSRLCYHQAKIVNRWSWSTE